MTNLNLGQVNLIVQVLDKKAVKDKYQIAVIKRPVEFSKETYSKAYNDFSQFVAQNKTLEKLVENAEEKIKKSEQVSLENSFRSGNITLEDFSKQLSMANKLGSLSSVIKYLPGMANLNISSAQIEQSEKEMKKFRAIIGSMTKKEKLYPKILDDSRKKRVAKGAGVTITDVAQLLQRFEQSQQFVKLLKKKKYFN